MRAKTLLVCAMGWGAVLGVWTGCGSDQPFTPSGQGGSAGGSAEDSGTPKSDTGAAMPGCGIMATVVHGVTADGRVNVSAAEAWPSRPAEPAALTPADLLGACAIISACFSQIGDAGVSEADQVKGIASCVDPKTHTWEERVVPDFNQNERWSFKVRTILAAKGCGGVLTLSTRPQGVTCEEAGCWGTGANTVTCQGDVATLTTAMGTFTRDCSHSYTTCSTTTGTGCTDRQRVACESASNDRCDADIKLGCDRCGLVSFHDCALLGGHCMENPGGAACVYPDPAACTTAPTCQGSALTFCAGGVPTTVDCVQLGLKGCMNGHCTK